MHAMTWTHADWETQPTPAGRLTALRAWRSELRAALTLGVTGTGHAVNSSDIRQALKDSESDLLRLEAQVPAAGAIVIRTSRTRVQG
jgi:hypothetical protein